MDRWRVHALRALRNEGWLDNLGCSDRVPRRQHRTSTRSWRGCRCRRSARSNRSAVGAISEIPRSRRQHHRAHPANLRTQSVLRHRSHAAQQHFAQQSPGALIAQGTAAVHSATNGDVGLMLWVLLTGERRLGMPVLCRSSLGKCRRQTARRTTTP